MFVYLIGGIMVGYLIRPIIDALVAIFMNAMNIYLIDKEIERKRKDEDNEEYHFNGG